VYYDYQGATRQMERNRQLLNQSRTHQESMAADINERDEAMRSSQRQFWDWHQPFMPFPDGDYGRVAERRALGGGPAAAAARPESPQQAAKPLQASAAALTSQAAAMDAEAQRLRSAQLKHRSFNAELSRENQEANAILSDLKGELRSSRAAGLNSRGLASSFYNSTNAVEVVDIRRP